MDIELDQIPGAIEVRLGLPRADWNLIWERLGELVGESNRQAAWDTLVHQWLERLRDALSRRSKYEVVVSDRFILLSSADHATNERILYWCETARRTTLDSLPRLKAEEHSWIVLAFADADTYYTYVADLYPDEGKFGESAGMCLSECSQIVFNMALNWQVDRTVAHEIVHAQLADLPLPLWLNEGVTQLLEDRIVESDSFQMSASIKEEHRQYWNDKTIAEFWIGNLFHAPGDGQRLAYSLAEVLVRNIIADRGKKFQDFLFRANWMDAGESAAREIFGCGLGDCVAQFLGPGNWQPTLNLAMTATESDSKET
jgi:hypothetical protein